MSHDHDIRAGRRHLRPLVSAFAVVGVFMLVELVVGLWTRSLALTADAGHMATDAIGLGMALAAIVAADRARPGGDRTYGLYRLEIFAALANAVLLFGVAGYVIVAAVTRLGDSVEIETGPMLIVAVVGLAVNVFAWRLLRPGAGESLNVEGAYLEVLGDLLASVGVVVAAVVVATTGWTAFDSIVGIAIGLFIIPRAWRLARKAMRVLVESAPAGLDVNALQTELAAIDGVTEVHDLHAWTLTSGMDAATAHLVVPEGVDTHAVLDDATALLRSTYGIAHATIQVEPDSHEGCAEVSW